MKKDMKREGETKEEFETRKVRKKEKERVLTEEEKALVLDIFGEVIPEPLPRKIPLKWKDYDIEWCGQCRRYIISCFYCDGTSCNGGGCYKCLKDTHDFNQWLVDEGF